MANERESELNDILRGIAESLDIPSSKYNQAVKSYRAVGDWLEGGQYGGCLGVPDIFPQGSFRLGTVVRPVRDGKETNYDIDLVCQVPMAKSIMIPGTLKCDVGDRLKEHADYRRMLDAEGRRCWTLEYAEQDDIGFHMDILPAVPDDDNFKNQLVVHGIPWEYAQHALAITEKNRRTGSYSWKMGGTNPAGYADWFQNINRPMFVKVASTQKRLLMENQRAIYCSVDDVPDALVRTPLQRVVQILKRHRDMRFLRHKWEDYKPISIIITTLAAQAYQSESDVYSALRNIVDRLDVYARLLSPAVVIREDLPGNLIRKQDGRWYIPNPVNHGENFADRWNEAGSYCAEAFFHWTTWVKKDLQTALGLRDIRATRSFLEPAFGRQVTETVLPPKPAPSRVTYPAVSIINPSKPWGANGGR
jgi:hypothetical protein